MSLYPNFHPSFSLLADGKFALVIWLFKPYPEDHLTTAVKRAFNFLLCSPRVVLGDVFWELRGRWRGLRRDILVGAEFMPSVFEACKRLYNFLIRAGDGWTDTVDVQEGGDRAVAADAFDNDTNE